MPQTTANSQPMAQTPKNGAWRRAIRRQQQAAGVKHAGRRPQAEAPPGRPGAEAGGERQQKSHFAPPEAEERAARHSAAPPAKQPDPGQRRADQALPFPMHGQGGDQPEKHENRAAGTSASPTAAATRTSAEARANPEIAEVMASHQARRAGGPERRVSGGESARQRALMTPIMRRRLPNARADAAEPPFAGAKDSMADSKARGRNPASRSAGTPVRYKPTATSGNSTGAFRRRCG